MKKTKKVKCPDCNGKGYIYNPFGINEYEKCDTCDGSGKIIKFVKEQNE